MKKVVFMGTPDFAVPALKVLIDNPDYDVKLVVSQPDKPQGRHQELTPPPVKVLALQYNIEMYQPQSLKTDEAYEKIVALNPDFIVVSAYGKILPKAILDIPKYGCVNLHGSLLPKYRGAAPIQWSVINGDKKTGVTTMLMDVGLDTGDILLTEETQIGEEETAGELFDRLANLCPQLLIKTLKALEEGTLTPKKQNEQEATYVSMLSKEMAVINWMDSAENIHNKVRGMSPWPVAKTTYNSKLLKIFACRVSNKKYNGVPGEVIAENGEIIVVCGNNTAVNILELQIEGSKRMKAADFLRGRGFEKGQKLV